MTENTFAIEEVPPPFDPAETEKDIARVRKLFDDLESDPKAPIPRKLHDILQDDVLSVVATLQKQIGTLSFYLSSHEDRISEIEEGEMSQLLPEDAAPLVAYLQRSVEIFEQLHKTQGDKLPGIQQMVIGGQQMLEFIEQITLPPDGDDDDDSN